MTARKPNNLPWIILGGFCGLGVLGLFGLGVYSGAKAVSDEMSVTIPELPKASDQAEVKNKLTIVVDNANAIIFNGEPVADVETLTKTLLTMDRENLESTLFILRISEDSSHTQLIAIKDMLDEFEARSMIEVMRSDEK